MIRAKAQSFSAAAAVLVLAGLMVLTAKHMFHGHDLAYIWLAGRAWCAAINPYDARYVPLGTSLLAKEIPVGFFYPPHWWPIAVIVQLVSLTVAAKIWAFACIGEIIGAQIVMRTIFPAKSMTAFYLAICFSLSSSATQIIMGLGQTSILLALAYAVVLLGMHKRNTIVTAAGAAIVMLKPNLGMILLAPLLIERRGLLALLCGAMISVVMAAPALLMASPTDIVGHYMSNMANYDIYYVNTPPSQTGIANLLFHLFAVNVSAVALSVAGAVIAIGSYWLLSRHETDNERRTFALLLAGSCSAMFFARVHFYDLIFIGLLLQPLFKMTLPASIRIACVIGLALIYRTEDLVKLLPWALPDADAVPGSSPTANLAVSLVTIVMFVALGAYILVRVRAQSGAPSGTRAA